MSANEKKRLWSEVDSKKKEVLKLASDLVKMPSENPPGDMGEISHFIVDYLSAEGLRCETHEPEKGRVNILCSIGKGGGRKLVLNGHMDVVPAGDPSRWSYPPYCGRIENGFLLGRGASDMKGGLAGIISAMKLLIKAENRLNGSVTLTVVPDEETMGTFGTGWLLDKGLVSPNACIIAEPTDVPLIDVGQKGALWGKVKVLGTPIHGSLSPHKGDSAILKACKVMGKMFEITKLQIVPPSDIAEVIQSSKPLVEKLIGLPGVGIILSSPTLNIGIIRGGTKVNMVPASCELEFDMRLPIGFTVEQAAEKINELLLGFGKDVSMEIAMGIDPNYTAPSAQLVTQAKDNVAKLLKKDASVFVQWASSDARHFRLRKIDTIHYGPAIIEGIHGLDEKVKSEDILTATKVYLGTALDYLA